MNGLENAHGSGERSAVG